MQLRIMILCAVVGTVVTVGFQLAAPDNLVIWSADFESGDISQWYYRSPVPDSNLVSLSIASSGGGGMFNSGVADSVPSTDRAHSGAWSLKMTIATPPESGTRFFRWREPQMFPKLIYTAWYYLPQQYSVATYWNIMQWKSARYSDQNDPFFVLNIGNRRDGSMFLYLYDCRQRKGYSQAVTNLPIGQWVRIDASYACAGDQTGRISIWQDRALLIDVPGVQTRYPNGDCEWSVNNYSDKIDPSPTVIYLDDASISLEKEASIR